MASRQPLTPIGAHRKALGAAAEAQAAAWYERQGWRVVARNWRCRAGELDLVVAKGGTLAFVEVKARTSDRFGLPAEAVTREKQGRIHRLALEYVRATGVRPRRIRFDVAAVLAGRLEVIEAAF